MKEPNKKPQQQTKRINLDLPPHVHEYLDSLHGTKKHNAEALLFAAARKNGFRPQ